ncbi:MAG: hypothetical protein BWY15_01965 [Firmicutes bacterium ADurb.Bin193]|nr:MAG: hypothetical protein BWY15_01965 [Firmicutes bacterium ADurb.Bin193]
MFEVGIVGLAYFVKLPFTVNDLKKPHDTKDKRQFRIVRTVDLAQIDYENFINDLCVDRQFIEDNAGVMRITDGEYQCIFVSQKGKTDGILVMSDGEDFPKYAAYLA